MKGRGGEYCFIRISKVPAVMVGSGTGRDGNGNPECFSFPTATSPPLPDLGLCSQLLPSRIIASCPDCFPPRRNVYSRLSPSRRPLRCFHPIPPFARNFSHPATLFSGTSSHPVSLPYIQVVIFFPIIGLLVFFCVHASSSIPIGIIQHFGYNNHLQQQ